jgi:hypothetical protein
MWNIINYTFFKQTFPRKARMEGDATLQNTQPLSGTANPCDRMSESFISWIFFMILMNDKK